MAQAEGPCSWVAMGGPPGPGSAQWEWPLVPHWGQTHGNEHEVRLRDTVATPGPSIRPHQGLTGQAQALPLDTASVQYTTHEPRPEDRDGAGGALATDGETEAVFRLP